MATVRRVPYNMTVVCRTSCNMTAEDISRNRTAVGRVRNKITAVPNNRTAIDRISHNMTAVYVEHHVL